MSRILKVPPGVSFPEALWLIGLKKTIQNLSSRLKTVRHVPCDAGCRPGSFDAKRSSRTHCTQPRAILEAFHESDLAFIELSRRWTEGSLGNHHWDY